MRSFFVYRSFLELRKLSHHNWTICFFTGETAFITRTFCVFAGEDVFTTGLPTLVLVSFCWGVVDPFVDHNRVIFHTSLVLLVIVNISSNGNTIAPLQLIRTRLSEKIIRSLSSLQTCMKSGRYDSATPQQIRQLTILTRNNYVRLVYSVLLWTFARNEGSNQSCYSHDEKN